MESQCFVNSSRISTIDILNEFLEFIKKVEKICSNASEVEFVNELTDFDKVSEKGLIEIKYLNEISTMGTIYSQDSTLRVAVNYRVKVEFEKSYITREILRKIDIIIGFITGDKSRIPDGILDFDGENYFDGSWYFSAQENVAEGVSCVMVSEINNLSNRDIKIAHYQIIFDIRKR
jgi:hypothetical protein